MSSTPFAVEIRVDNGLRRLVYGSGILLWLSGAAIALTTNLAWHWRLLLFAAWVADCVRNIRRQRLGAERFVALRLDVEGRVHGRQPDGRLVTLELLSGTLVTSRYAWLRVRSAGGLRSDELLLAERVPEVTWHRLQLLWQQSRESFGQTRRA